MSALTVSFYQLSRLSRIYSQKMKVEYRCSIEQYHRNGDYREILLRHENKQQVESIRNKLKNCWESQPRKNVRVFWDYPVEQFREGFYTWVMIFRK